MRALLEKGSLPSPSAAHRAGGARRTPFSGPRTDQRPVREWRCWLPDLATSLGISLAEKLGLPLLQAYYVPFTPTRPFPARSFLSRRRSLGGWFDRLTHHATREIMWQGSRSADKLGPEQVLGLPAASFWGPYGSECLRGLPVLYAIQPVR